MTSRGARSLALPVFLSLAVLAAGCSRAEPEPKPRPEPTAKALPTPTPPVASDSAAAPAANASMRAPDGPLVLARGVRIVHAGAGDDAAKVVRDERERARSDGRDLVVYVGAKWCEPCQYFHKAAAKGELDAEFPDLTLLEFDLDDNRVRLLADGGWRDVQFFGSAHERQVARGSFKSTHGGQRRQLSWH